MLNLRMPTGETASLQSLEARVTALNTRLAMLAADKDRAANAGGVAKTYLDNKDAVQQVLQETQSVLFGEKISLFENFLSNLTRDTLPPDLARDVKFELKVKNNKAHLLLNLVRGDNLEDAENASGGSISNILEVGQRYVTLFLADKRKFMVLDEPDCWLKDIHVPNFAATIANFANELGTQTIYISHHDLEALVMPYRVELKYSNGLVKAVPNFKPEALWDATMPGIRFVELEGVHQHTNTRIDLAPTTTLLCGDNNIGKSSINIALRSVCYDLGDDRLIQHDKTKAVVRIGIENGFVITYTRNRKGSPKNTWMLTDAQGTVLYNTKDYVDAVPWLKQHLNIDNSEGVDIQLAHQKRPTALLFMPNDKRAQLLNLGHDSMYLDSIQQNFNAAVRAQQAVVLQSERELERIRRIEQALPDMTTLQDTVTAGMTSLSNMVAGLEKVLKEKEALLKLQPQAKRLDELTQQLNALPDTNPVTLVPLQSMALSKVAGDMAKVRNTLKAMDSLPEAAPAAVPALTVHRLVELQKQVMKLASLSKLNTLPEHGVTLPSELQSITIGKVYAQVQTLTGTMRTLNANMVKLEEEKAALPSLVGVPCPVCGAVDHQQH